MNTIEQLYKEWLSLQPLNPEDQKRLDKKFMLEFNYNSNHLEGNTLTYGQTKLLFMFGETTGNARLRDYEEMKAHNVGLELMKMAAKDMERPLTENFIRELNKTILVENFWKATKTPDGTPTRYKINVGAYKTRPNSVITVSGDLFDYASPEETPALMTDLVRWYNSMETRLIASSQSPLTLIELAALFHYRYIRIHPFEDGNGRIARLLVNYVLLRNGFPMVVIKTDDKTNYLKMLHLCDIETGVLPFEGARADIKQITPFVEYLTDIIAETIRNNIKYLKEQKGGTNNSVWWYNGNEISITNEKRQLLLELLLSNPQRTVRELTELLSINKSAVQKHLDFLKKNDYIIRQGGTKGKWIVNIENSVLQNGGTNE
ncbi:MAG: Fic family protein [Dysgonamonadaceae bacterium]|jgi:Fic family protein|nr:Fic family protein [Dysgonamonadaceae bacterium]